MNEAPVLLARATASPRGVRRRSVRAAGGGTPVRWLFLGRDYLAMRRWERELGIGFVRESYAERLQGLGLEWRKPYLDWLSSLAAANPSLEWWTSRIAERNTGLESLFHWICYLHIAREAALRPGPLLVIAERQSILDALGRQADLRARLRWCGRAGLLPASFEFARVGARWACYFADAMAGGFAARMTRSAEVPVPRPSATTRVVLHSCIDEGYFTGEGVDRYFGGLRSELEKRGLEVVVLPWLFNVVRSRRAAYAWFRQRPRRYVLADDFYRWRDSVWAARVVWRQRRLPLLPQSFAGMDVSALVGQARRMQAADASIAPFVRYVRLIEHWKDAGFRFDVFIDMFENQIPEKPQVLALRSVMPEVRTVGFQHYIGAPPLHLCLFTTTQETAIAPHPDVIVSSSPFVAEISAREGFEPSRLRVGPSLRHHPPLLEARPAETGTVLVVLSMDSAATAEMMWKVGSAFPASDDGLTFWLKPHPMMPSGLLQRLSLDGAWPRHMTVVGGSMDEWIRRASCAVISASTAALELALAGMPVIVVGRETDFDLSPLAWFPDFEPPARDADALRKRVLDAVHLPDVERARLVSWARSARARCLSPINDQTIEAFIRPLAAADGPVARACAQ